MIFPSVMSWLMTSVNSFRPSPMAPLSASVKSCERRASDSMMRSRTMYCAILAADWGVMEGSKDCTFEAMLTAGIGGRIHTRAEPETDPELLGGGRAADAELETQPAIAGPAPTDSATVGVEPSASPAAGSGL